MSTSMSGYGNTRNAKPIKCECEYCFHAKKGKYCEVYCTYFCEDDPHKKRNKCKRFYRWHKKSLIKHKKWMHQSVERL